MAGLQVPAIGLRSGNISWDVDLIYRWLLLLLQTLNGNSITGLTYFTTVPTVNDISDGSLGFSLISDTLTVYVNEGGVIKQLILGVVG